MRIESIPTSVFTDLRPAQGAAREFVRDRMANQGELVVAKLGQMNRYIVVTRMEFNRFSAACGWQLA